ncbi:MAG: iron dicitrate transport regulator FecR [Burkholderiales bacterium PBB6]|nr:MAG: iron dicitrate transport regulator FecR [Burkholderiales bacterium PBB6]
MLEETREAADAVTRQLSRDEAVYSALGADLRREPFGGMLTVARGSSDHAAHYMAYLAMARMGRLVTSLPMSLLTLHQSSLRCEGITSVAFSQSGQSPDLITPTAFFRAGGARTLAVVNDEASPLARAAEWVLPLHAGPERSVAATKSYIAQLVAGARLVAHWQGDEALLAALSELPTALRQAAALDWQPAVDTLVNADKLFVISRGTGLAVAMEAALKFKETCGIQAEAFSGAEVKHGPMALVGAGYPLLVFAPRGPAQEGLVALAAEMRQRGGTVLLAAPQGTPGADLPLATTHAVDLDPVAAIQSFYPMVEALARARGHNPDEPRHLSKVTRTH